MRLPQNVLLDTDLLIASRGVDSPARAFLATLDNHHFVCSSISVIEYAIGERGKDKRLNQSVEKRFNHFLVLPVDRAVYLQAVREATRYGGGEAGKLKMPDLTIAATALVTGRTLITRNIKDFANIPNLRLIAWG